MKGFALLLATLFLLVLTLFSLCFLTIASTYYASARSLFENQNAKLACEESAIQMIDTNNLGPPAPRFFFDPQRWQGQQLQPFLSNGYSISGSLAAPWNGSSSNALRIVAEKGRYRSELHVEVRQKRFERFALYTEKGQILPGNSLIDGPVFAREPIELMLPGTSFREIVQGDVQPESYAVFHKKTLHTYEYPLIGDMLSLSFFSDAAALSGFPISNQNPVFWVTDHYELNLDLLNLVATGKSWQLSYNGSVLGKKALPILYFDAPVWVRQSDQDLDPLSAKSHVPLYIVSASEVQIRSNLQSLESATALHSLCLIAGTFIHLTSQIPLSGRIEAGLVSLGTSAPGLRIDAGGMPSSVFQKQILQESARRSTLLLEDQIRTTLNQALQNDNKTLWIRGCVVIQSTIEAPLDLVQLDLVPSRETFGLLPPLPFVEFVDGSQVWQ